MSHDWEIEDIFVFDDGRTVVLVNMPVAIKQTLPSKASILRGGVESQEIVVKSERMPGPGLTNRRSFETWDHVDAKGCSATKCWLRFHD